MGEPARSDTGSRPSTQGEDGGKSMEDILASIRKIIARENKQADEASEVSSEMKTTASAVHPAAPIPQAEEVAPSSTGQAAPAAALAPKADTPSQTPGGLAALAEKMRQDRLGRASEQPRTVSSTVEEQSPAPQVNSGALKGPAERGIVSDANSKAAEDSDVNGSEASPVQRSSMSLKEIAELAKLDTSKPAPQATVAAKAETPLKTPTERPEQNPTATSSLNTEVSSARVQNRANENGLGEVEEAASVPEQNKTYNAKSRETDAPAENVSRTATATTGSIANPDQMDSPTAFREALVSPATQEAVSNSMQRLKKRVENIESAEVEAVLRPLLKQWLDENLPGMVERMVSEEIKAIAKHDQI